MRNSPPPLASSLFQLPEATCILLFVVPCLQSSQHSIFPTSLCLMLASPTFKDTSDWIGPMGVIPDNLISGSAGEQLSNDLLF